MRKSSKPDLSLVSLDDLINELAKRVDCFIVAYYQVLEVKREGQCRLVRKWKGNAMTCAGMATAISHAIIRNWHESTVDDQGIGF